MTDADRDPKEALLEAALPHVPFDGWTDATFRAAITDSGVAPALARVLCPRGAVDLALAFHRRGDAEMLRRLATEDLSGMRFRDRIAAAVRFRLEAVEDRELVRRGTTLFSLPQYAADGAKAIWETCDAIWTALGDTSEDVNWYTKRATLAGVYSATVLYWLGDDSPGHENTWAFLDRRIDNVMQIEKAKAQIRKSPLLKGLFAGPLWALGQVKAPRKPFRDDLPGSLTPHHQEKQ
ncbi:COQ9 family protein [Actibacterium sp. MT2.3-13A]|uniref:COQ9 family protein n=1 Tax=Actibacterium sp. MT2.3-13A TaxID=2828332 RepID=UPI001BA91314|nr:COQ9 family protein [Actibacterium sp. MT2.3-13A]